MAEKLNEKEHSQLKRTYRISWVMVEIMPVLAQSIAGGEVNVNLSFVERNPLCLEIAQIMQHL